MADLPRDPHDELLAALVDAVDEYAIFMLDPSGRVGSWNPGVKRIKGYTEDEIVGRHFSIFFTGEDVEHGKPDRLLRHAATTGRASDQGWRVRKDSTLFRANVVITALFDDEGQVRGFVKVTRDETDRHRAEKNERELERLQDQEAIGQRLNGTLINRLFSAGLIVEGLRTLCHDPLMLERIDALVDELDQAINDVRNTLFRADRDASRHLAQAEHQEGLEQRG